MEIRRTRKFIKSYAKLSESYRSKVKATLKSFFINPSNRILNNHSLKWKFSWLRSINVTGDIRIIFRDIWNSSYEIVELIDIWTHSQLYW